MCYRNVYESPDTAAKEEAMRFSWESTGKSGQGAVAWCGTCADESQRARLKGKGDGWYAEVKCGVSGASRLSGPFAAVAQAKRWAQRAADELRAAVESERPATALEPAQGRLATAVMQSARLLEAVDRFKETRSATYETLMFERADDLRVALGRQIDEMAKGR